MHPLKTIATDSTAIHVWKISVSDNIQFLLAHHASVLSKEELDKSDSFFQKKDRESYLVRRIMIRLLLAKSLDCSAGEIQFKEGENKKPIISYPSAAIHFNISHSGDYILIAIANTPIGIDVEKIDPLFQYRDIMDQYFNPEEQLFIQENQDEAVLTFFLVWTLKEAYVKYTGEGLLGDLMDMPSVINLPDNSGINQKDGISFYVQSRVLDDSYYMSLIYPIGDSEIDYFEYDHRLPISSFLLPSEA